MVQDACINQYKLILKGFCAGLEGEQKMREQGLISLGVQNFGIEAERFFTSPNFRLAEITSCTPESRQQQRNTNVGLYVKACDICKSLPEKMQKKLKLGKWILGERKPTLVLE